MTSSQEPTTTSALFSSLAQQLPITAIATINDTDIYLEVATGPEQQATGLMYRTSLDDNRGMLFPFASPRAVKFWMRNVEIHLDMIFIQDGKVVAIEANVPPCRTTRCAQYGPSVPINNVLELKGGRAAELGVEIGDSIVITEIANTSQESSKKYKN